MTCAVLQPTVQVDFDPDRLSLCVQDGRLEHVQLGRGRFTGRIAHSASDVARVDWGRYGLALLARGDMSGERLTVALPVSGHGDWRVQGAAAADGDLVVFGEGAELLATLPAQAQWLSVQLDRHEFERAGIDAPARRAAPLRLRMPDAAALRTVLGGVAPLLGPLDGDAPAPDGHALQAAHRQLADALLSQVARGHGAGDATPMGRAERTRVLRNAEAWLHGRDACDVRLADLCEAAATSLSRLERAFREGMGMGPARYLMLRRLAGARRDLRRTDAPEVTQVALLWGFGHLGRFAQVYRQHYGELPSLTRRAALAGAAVG